MPSRSSQERVMTTPFEASPRWFGYYPFTWQNYLYKSGYPSLVSNSLRASSNILVRRCLIK